MQRLSEKEVMARLSNARKNVSTAVSKSGQLIVGGVIIFYDYHNVKINDEGTGKIKSTVVMTRSLLIDGVQYPISEMVDDMISCIEYAVQKFRIRSQNLAQKIQENIGR